MAKSKFRYKVEYQFRGQTRYGIVSSQKSRKPGYVIVEDAVLPFSAEVLDTDTKDVAERKDFPTYDMNTGYITKGGDKYDHFVNAAHMQADADDKAAGKGVKVGRMFTLGVADGRAYYVVVKVGPKTCKVEWRGFCLDRYVDQVLGYGKTLPAKDVAQWVNRADSWDAYVTKADQRDRAVITSQPVGAFIHYIQSRAEKWPQFVRFKIVEMHGGEKVAQFVGICGTWPDHSLPHRTPWGGEYMAHEIESLLKEPMKKKLCASYVWESATGDTADVKRSVLPDPHTLPLLDLTMPEPTKEQLLCGRVNDVLQAVRNAANGEGEKNSDFNSVVAMRRLAKAYKAIRAELMHWTVDDFAHNGLKDRKLCEIPKAEQDNPC